MAANVGELVRAALAARGCKQAWLAQEMGVSQSYVSLLLAGKRPWTACLRSRVTELLASPEDADAWAGAPRGGRITEILATHGLADCEGQAQLKHWAMLVEEMADALEKALRVLTEAARSNEPGLCQRAAWAGMAADEALRAYQREQGPGEVA